MKSSSAVGSCVVSSVLGRNLQAGWSEEAALGAGNVVLLLWVCS